MKSNKPNRNTWKAEEPYPVREGENSTVQVLLTFSFENKQINKWDPLSLHVWPSPPFCLNWGSKIPELHYTEDTHCHCRSCEALALPWLCPVSSWLCPLALPPGSAQPVPPGSTHPWALSRAPSQPHATLAPSTPSWHGQQHPPPRLTKRIQQTAAASWLQTPDSSTDSYRCGSSAS